MPDLSGAAKAYEGVQLTILDNLSYVAQVLAALGQKSPSYEPTEQIDRRNACRFESHEGVEFFFRLHASRWGGCFVVESTQGGYWGMVKTEAGWRWLGLQRY